MDVIAALALIAGLALAPALVYLLALWWLDRYEKEPVHLFVLAFVWGAIPAVVLGIVFELILSIPLGMDAIADFTSGSIIAPVVEEITKGIIVFVLFLAYRHEFDDVLDGIIYGAVVGLGFSVVEDFLYGLSALSEGGMGGVVSLAVVRSGIFGLNHSFFTSLTGAALGAIRYSRSRGTRIFVPLLGLSGAIFFHALHNTLVSIGYLMEDEGLAVAGCLLSLVSAWGGVLVVLVLAILSISRQRRWIEQQLWEEVVVGRFTPEEYHMLTSSWRRWGARLNAIFDLGFKAGRQLGRLQHLATELAFRKHQVLVEHDPAWSQYDIQLLRARIDDLHSRMRSA